jgi:hypothetical protein
MKKLLIASQLALALAAVPAFANDTLNFTMKAQQNSLRDTTQKDNFTVTLADKQVETTFAVKCQGAKGGFITRQEQSCAVTGNGALINPNNGQRLQRTQYAGGWVEKSDGYTDGSKLTTNYLTLGKVAASSSGFGGSIMLKPQNPSTTASAIRDLIMKKVKSTETGLIDERVDTIQFNNFTTPSAGLPSDKGCVWNGDMVYSYQTESWFMQLTTKCAGKEYALKGNMPYTATPNVGNQHQYDLTLTLPAADSTGDDALFTQPTGDKDLFANADGISGQIIMKESDFVDVEIDGQPDKVPANIDATGTFTGQNVPLEAVRSLTTIIAVLSRTFFGA